MPAGHEEADEEVRRQRAPLRLHQPEPVPEVLHRQRNDQGVDGQQVVENQEEGQDHLQCHQQQQQLHCLSIRRAISQFFYN